MSVGVRVLEHGKFPPCLSRMGKDKEYQEKEGDHDEDHEDGDNNYDGNDEAFNSDDEYWRRIMLTTQVTGVPSVSGGGRWLVLTPFWLTDGMSRR